MFNFFVNIDGAVNDSNYDMFLYRAVSENKIDFQNVSLKEGMKYYFDNLTIKLNRDSFLIDQYQVTGCMRCQYKEKAEWKDSVLYKLLMIHFYMTDTGHSFKLYKEKEKKFNLILLYDVAETQAFKEEAYDMKADLPLLWDYLGVSIGSSEEDSEEKKPFYQELLEKADEKKEDDITKWMVREILRVYQPLEENGRLLEKAEESVIAMVFGEWLKQLSYFNVVCRYVYKHRREENVVAVLKILEFLYSGQEFNYDNFTAVWKKKNNYFFEKYGAVLLSYQKRLGQKYKDLTQIPSKEQKKISIDLWHRDIIPIETREPFTKKIERFETELQNRMNGFESGGAASEEAWQATYAELKELINKIDKVLKEYAEELEEQYFSQVNDFKKTDGNDYKKLKVTAETELNLATVKEWEAEEEKIYELLKETEVEKEVNLNDLLQLEAKLDQLNRKMGKRLRSMDGITLGGFLFLALLVSALFVGHYACLQYYVFTEFQYFTVFGVYALIVVLGLFTGYTIPRMVIRSGIKKELSQIKSYVNGFLAAYKSKADYFVKYINCMNRLEAVYSAKGKVDYVLNKKRQAERMKLWHVKQIKRHLDKLRYFDDFLHAYGRLDKQYLETEELDFYADVMDNMLYWPMGRQKDMHEEVKP